MNPTLKRRDLLKSSVALLTVAAPLGVCAPADAQGDPVVQFDIELSPFRRVAHRGRVLVPRAHRSMNGPRPLLVLLHGLGEAHSQTLALRAWPELYGLTSACQRLLSPPLARDPRARYLRDERLVAINADLAAAPISLPILVCPMTPKPPVGQGRQGFFDAYAAWLEQELIPAVRAQLKSRGVQSSGLIGLDGCSMGGAVATEVFLRRPRTYATFGTVQSAIGISRAVRYAAQFRDQHARAKLCPVHIESSTEDPFRRANERLSRELTKYAVPHALDVIPGPHNQPWLREVGTLEMLRWHARQLALVYQSEVNCRTSSSCNGNSFSSSSRDGSSKSANSKPGETVQPTKL